jgi:hypothetical protein
VERDQLPPWRPFGAVAVIGVQVARSTATRCQSGDAAAVGRHHIDVFAVGTYPGGARVGAIGSEQDESIVRGLLPCLRGGEAQERQNDDD